MPSLQVFDWPDALTSTERRSVTTTPSQALVFMNDPAIRSLAEGFARRVAVEPDQVGSAFALALARPPSDRERARATAFVEGQQQSYGGDLERALTDFCAGLMSTSEFIYVE